MGKKSQIQWMYHTPYSVDGSMKGRKVTKVHYMRVSRKKQVDELCEGDAIDRVKHLKINLVDSGRLLVAELPHLPQILTLAIRICSRPAAMCPIHLSAEALPKLDKLNMDGCGPKTCVYPFTLEGPFDSLRSIKIEAWPLTSELRVAALFHSKTPVCFPNLLMLNLTKNDMLGDACVVLARALQSQACPALRFLVLSQNAFGDEGCVALAAALEDKACPSLAVLDLEECGIRDLGFEFGRGFQEQGLSASPKALSGKKFSRASQLYSSGGRFQERELRGIVRSQPESKFY